MALKVMGRVQVVVREGGRLKVFRLATEVGGDLLEGYGSPENERDLGGPSSVRAVGKGMIGTAKVLTLSLSSSLPLPLTPPAPATHSKISWSCLPRGQEDVHQE